MKYITEFIVEKLKINKDIIHANSSSKEISDLYKKAIICLLDFNDYKSLSWNEIQKKCSKLYTNTVVNWIDGYEIDDFESYITKELIDKNKYNYQYNATSEYSIVDPDFIEDFVKKNVKKGKDKVFGSSIQDIYMNDKCLYFKNKFLTIDHLLVKN